MSNRNEHLAVIPAYNEAATVARCRRRACRERAPSCDVLVVNDGSTDDTADRARAAGADVLELPFNLGIGGAVQAGFVYAQENGYRFMVAGRRRRPARAARDRDAAGRDGAPTRPSTWSAARASWCPGEYLAPISRRTRHPRLRVPALADRRPAGDRSDVGLPALQPPRDRAVRGRLPARLPRGRGGADAPPPPPADGGGAACACSSAAAAARRSAPASPSTT